MLVRFAALCLLLTTAATAQTALQLGEAAEKTLASDGRDSYTLTAEIGQFVSGAVDQRSVDVVLSILRPDGVELESIDVTGRGDDLFNFVTESVGAYTFVVTPFEGESGAYAMRIDRLEPKATEPAGIIEQRLSYRSGPHSPGAVVGVIDGGELAFVEAMGQANLTYGIPYTVDTPTNIGSTSKQFTAFAIGLLAEQGKVSLDDDVRKHIPELPEFDQTVTLRHLLTHTSGYREFLNTLYVAGRKLNDGDFIDRDEIIAMVQRQPELQNVPGAEFNYNNTGYLLLATVVERVTGEDFPDWMTKNVFEPVGMTHTVVRPNATAIVPGRAVGYVAGADGWAEVSDISYSMGAGGIYSTVGDLAKWMQNLMYGRYGDDVIRQMATRSLLNDGTESEYGLGLFIDEKGGMMRVQHGGADSAHRSMFTLFPEQQRGVIVLTNSKDDTNSIAADAARAFFGGSFGRGTAPVEVVVEPGDFTFDDQLFDDYAGRYALDVAPDFILTFRRSDTGGYETQATGQGPVPMIATSDSTFKLTVVNASLTFQRDADGVVRSLTLDQGGLQRATRLDLEDVPAPPDVNDFVGRFESEELDATYSLRVEDGALIANQRRAGDVTLSHSKGDAFQGGPMTMTFERDATGAVTAFVVDAGRTRGIRFDRR